MKTLFFTIIDDPKKRKQLVIALIVLIIIMIGVARYTAKDISSAGEVVHAGNEAGQEAEPDENKDSASNIADGDQAGSTENVVGDAGSEPGTVISGEDSSIPPVAVFVDVGGAVVRAGVIALPPGSRITDAIEAAGGLTEYADISVINRAQIVADGDKLYIPTASEVENGHIKPSVGLVTGQGTGSAVSGASQAGSSTQTGNAPGTDAQGRININSADSETLQLLNGVGPATAQKIIDYRNSNGQFKRIEDIMNVSGIGQKTYERLKNLICV